MIEFVKANINSSSIHDAARQEEQLLVFTKSELQSDSAIVQKLSDWAKRNSNDGNHYENFIRSVFKPDIALKFMKYLRRPIVSAKLVNKRIIPNLKRVFHAEDSEFDYVVSNVDESEFIQDISNKKTIEKIFETLMFHHNSIYITDVVPDSENMPKQFIIPIEIVNSIQLNDCGDIEKISYRSAITGKDGKPIKGFTYIDSESYKFYDQDTEIELVNNPHDLGYTPARFVSSVPYDKTGVVRESIFTYMRTQLEEYVSLKTIQSMIEPNGAIPVAFKLDFKVENVQKDIDGPDQEPPSENPMSSKRAEYASQTGLDPGEGFLNAGSLYTVPLIPDINGKIDTEVVKNGFKWEFIPTEALEYLDKRIKDIEEDIVRSLIGDVIGQVEQAQNELQVAKSTTTLQNTLRDLSNNISQIKTWVDTDYLNVRYSPEKVQFVKAFFGSDFFLESEYSLYERLGKTSNPIERKNILIRINANKYKNNPKKLSRTKILYNLLPYSYDSDFDTALEQEIVSEEQKRLQLQFDYYLNIFEAKYGDIVEFFNSQDNDPQQTFILIKNLLNQIIKQDEQSNKTPVSQGA